MDKDIVPRLAQALFLALAYAYVAGLAAWLAAYFAFGDRWAWLFAINSFAAYLFLPLPLVAAIGLAAQHRPLWVAEDRARPGFGVAGYLGFFHFMNERPASPTSTTTTTIGMTRPTASSFAWSRN